jgi:hypothetical protein
MDPLAALTEGNEVQALTAARSVLAERLIEAEGASAAAISREFRAVLVELRRLGAGRTESALDEVADRRAKRRSGRTA